MGGRMAGGLARQRPSPGGCRGAEGRTPDPCLWDHPARPEVMLQPPQAVYQALGIFPAGRRRRPRTNDLGVPGLGLTER
jgi:hypothetical protein